MTKTKGTTAKVGAKAKPKGKKNPKSVPIVDAVMAGFLGDKRGLSHGSLIPEGKVHRHKYCNFSGEPFEDDFCIHCGKRRKELELKKSKGKE